MKHIKELIKKHPSMLRYISIVGIIAILFPTFFVGYYAGEAGKYFALGVYLLVAIVGSFEVLKNLNISKQLAIAISLSVAIMFFYPLNTFLLSDSPLKEWKHDEVLRAIKFVIDWKAILIVGLMPLLMFLDRKMWDDMNKSLSQVIIASITMILISIFGKFVWIVNIMDYTQLFYFIPIAIVADSFGYFGGKYLKQYFWDGKKLAPKLSPKKTWAGFIIGYVASAMFVGLVGWGMGIFNNMPNHVVILVVLTLLLPVVSPLGDLLFSGIKRHLGIKDFSNLMPGHGGVMDRIDAMSSVIFTIFIIVTIAL